jgi:hypothetical protein
MIHQELDHEHKILLKQHDAFVVQAENEVEKYRARMIMLQQEQQRDKKRIQDLCDQLKRTTLNNSTPAPSPSTPVPRFTHDGINYIQRGASRNSSESVTAPFKTAFHHNITKHQQLQGLKRKSSIHKSFFNVTTK